MSIIFENQTWQDCAARILHYNFDSGMYNYMTTNSASCKSKDGKIWKTDFACLFIFDAANKNLPNNPIEIIEVIDVGAEQIDQLIGFLCIPELNNGVQISVLNESRTQ